jgi:hypothetical protein
MTGTTGTKMNHNEPAQYRPDILPIERQPSAALPFERFLDGYIARNRPVIIQDAVPEWPALHTWTPQFFKEKFGSKQVDVTYGVSRPLGEVIDGVLSSTAEKPGPYLHKVIIHQHMPELLPDLTPQNVYSFPGRYASPLMPKRFRRPDGYLKLLIGGVGSKFPLMHFDSDNANAMITEIYGDKEFVLFRPQDTRFLYPFSEKGNTSQVDDLGHPDLEKFPLFAQATQYRGIIGPGEALFVPSGWWHTARVVTTSISVCMNMLHRPNWPGFISEACQAQNGAWARRNAKRLYLNSAGVIMSAAERSQEMFPRAALSRRLAALSPVQGEAAPAGVDHHA